MADILLTSHSNLMDQRAKGKKLHRRTQSSTKHDLNSLMNKKAASEEFVQEMLQSQNFPQNDATRRALQADALIPTEYDKEVIVDDIEDVPSVGFVVPKTHYSNNPLNLISKKNLTARVSSLGNLCPIKKVHLLDQIKDNIDEFTGLNTIHEKKNSLDSADTETLGNKSPDLLSICNSQGSKNPSRTHSKQSSLDIRPGHSKTSSADLRNVNFSQPLFELRPLSQNIKAEKENIHFAKKASTFAHEASESLANANSLTSGPNRRGHHSRAQNASAHIFTRINEPGSMISPKTQMSSINIVDTVSPKGLNIGSKVTQGTRGNPKNNLKTLPQREVNKVPEGHGTSSNGMETKIADLSESMKNLSSKTEMLENQIKSIFQVVDSFASDKNYLEEKVKAQDEKIKVLMTLASKYEEEINNLKGGRTLKLDNSIKYVSKRPKENAGQTILTTTDISAESPVSDNSGFHTNKETKNLSPFIQGTQGIQGQGQKSYNYGKNKDDLLSKHHHQTIEDPRLKRKGKH